MSAPAIHPVPALIDGRFELLREHRSGGMGTVFCARDRRDGRQVALKVLRDVGDEQRERFLREAHLLAELSDPGIVAHVAHGATSEGMPYLVMEWLEGETVAERLLRGRLRLDESLALLRSALRGLSVAHQRGIVHRDLKPSNLFSRGGSLDDIVLLDLGLARYAAGNSDLTRTGALLGTPSYMAPEQARGQADITPAADLFALGCVLFECLTGRPPFVSAQVFGVLAKIVFEPAPHLSECLPDAPPAIEQLCAALLAKDPAQRPADGARLNALLEALAKTGALPLSAAPSPAPLASAGEQQLVSVIFARPALAADSGTGSGVAPTQLDSESFDVAPYEGHLARLLDGTHMIAFDQPGAGGPSFGAATDLARRAARCALALRDRLPGWSIALSTGRAISREQRYRGEAVDSAASLLLRARSAVDGGAIAIDSVTAGLLDARFVSSPGEGGAFLLEGEARSIDAARPLLGRPTACVGREHELAMLGLALRECIEEQSPRAVLVSGEPGLGKSRLRHEFVRRMQLEHDGLSVLLGLGDPVRVASRSGLLRDALLRLCGIPSQHGEAERYAAFAARIGRHLGEDGAVSVAFLAELCGLRAAEQAPAELLRVRQDPRALMQQITLAWLAFLRAEAARHPVLIVLDDLQWSDATTISLIGAALRELDSSPCLVLALGRDETRELYPELWAPRLAQLPLRPLRPATAARFVRDVLGDRASDDSVQRIVARAQGNALYLEELIRASYQERDQVPETVLAMLQARIGLLPPPARRVLRAASIFGESVPLGGLYALERERAGERELEASLQALREQEILEGGVEPGARLRFRHALMCDAAYALLTPEDRRQLHASAASFLEASGEDSAVIAAHFERGAEPANALRHYIVATENAHRADDNAASIALAARGLALDPSPEQRGVLNAITAPAFFHRYDFAECWRASSEAARLLPPGHPRRAEGLAWRACVAVQIGKAHEVEAETDEMLAASPTDAACTEYGTALGFAHAAHTAVAHRQASQRLLARLLEIDTRLGFSNPSVHAHRLFAQTRYLLMLGDDPYAAWDAGRQGVEAHRRSPDPRMRAYIQAEFADAIRHAFTIDEAVDAARTALRLCESFNDVTAAYLQYHLAKLLAERGEPGEQAEARSLAENVLRLAGGANAYHAFGQLAMVQVGLRAGDLELAEQHARGALATFRAMDFHGYYPHADAALLAVLTRKGAPERATLADQALERLAQLGPLGVIELPVRLEAARAHHSAGCLEQARRGLSAALAMLERQTQKVPEQLRQRFSSEVREHVELRALAAQLGVGEREGSAP